MLTETIDLPADDTALQTTPTSRTTTRAYIHEYSAKQIKNALLPLHSLSDPLEELISTAEAAFEFIRTAEIDLITKNAFGQLEKLFDFYKNLMRE